MTDGPIRSILIAGGGTAGWMAALYLARRLERQGVAITLVESPAIPTVGVGEATVPGIRDYFRAVGIPDEEVLRATNGTVKLGIEFRDWAGQGSSFFHPFGLYGSPSRGVAFHHYWLKRRAVGDPTPLAEYSLGTKLALADRFMPPLEKPPADFAVFDWAVHFDAGLYAAMLSRIAQEAGVTRIAATIGSVARDGETGLLSAVSLDDGRRLEADLFIDCSGFRSLLLGGALGTPYVDWTHLLPCDRAIALPCANRDGFTPYTRSTALPGGWQWRIPLRHRVGNGYVYSSRHVSDDEALATLRANLEGEALAEPNLLRFATGHRERFWVGNCVALGLSAGFLEPLESTSITLIQTGVERLVDLFPTRACDPALADEYNRTTSLEYARIRDFLLLHYWGNRRFGEPLWDACRALELPEELAHKIRLFRARGKIVRYSWDTFLDPSWLSMYAGLGLMPEQYDPLADYFTDEQLDQALGRMREAIAQAMARSRPHADYLAALDAPPAAARAS